MAIHIVDDDDGFVMLAADAREADFRFPCIASPKVDGHRVYVKDAVARTRSGKRIANRATSELFSSKLLNGFDGEMVVGPPNVENTFNTTQRGLTTEARDPKANYLVFDVYDLPSFPFEVRLKELEIRISKLPKDMRERVVPVAQVVCHNLEDLLKFEKTCLEQGFEGLIVRSPSAPYKHGRSTVNERGMLKLKRFVDTEAVIVGMEEEIDKHGKPKGTCGSIICIDLKTEKETSCAGISHARKAELWALGARAHGLIITYRYTPCGTKDKPRHPRYKAVRDSSDMDQKLVKAAQRIARAHTFRFTKKVRAA